MRKPLPPCRSCNDRNESCHSSCLQFRAYLRLKHKYDQLVFNERAKEYRVQKALWLPKITYDDSHK